MNLPVARPKSLPLPTWNPPGPSPQIPPGIPSAPQFGREFPEDLRVPWGGIDIAVFIILLGIASIVVTWGLAEFAVRFLGANANAPVCSGIR